MHKESQFNRMMQALIHYSDCGIAKDKLEEIVIGERDIDAPHTALRVIVYKGSHGRHTDNSSNVMAWFKSQYNNLLHDDFQDKQINVAGHTVRCEQ